nr:unnamed protein product [Digitaria exilis]
MAAASVASQAQAVLRARLCDPGFVHSALRSSPDTNYSKLKYLVASSISEACNNSVLLLGPRGCGKAAVADMVLEDLKKEHSDAISVEIARQLCLEHQLSFSKMASSDDNTEFIIDMLRECGLAHKTILFILEEFDLFAQGKQRLLYSLLDAMQSLTSQAVVIGLSCRLVSGTFANNGQSFRAVSYMDMESGFLSMESFLNALSVMQRQPKMDSLQEYRSIQDAYKTSDKYASTVCFRAFEHLLDRELISFGDIRGRNQALEYRPVKLLISSRELAQSLKLNTTCPAVLQKLFDRERYM